MGMFCNGKVQFTSIYANIAKYIIANIYSNPNRLVSYEGLAARMGISERSLRNYLNELGAKCIELKMPPITAVVREKDKEVYGSFLDNEKEYLENKEIKSIQHSVFSHNWKELAKRMLIYKH